jgi:hypothetical protein
LTPVRAAPAAELLAAGLREAAEETPSPSAAAFTSSRRHFSSKNASTFSFMAFFSSVLCQNKETIGGISIKFESAKRKEINTRAKSDMSRYLAMATCPLHYCHLVPSCMLELIKKNLLPRALASAGVHQ